MASREKPVLLSETEKDRRLSRLYVVLCAVFLVNAVTAEFAGSKIFSAIGLFGSGSSLVKYLSANGIDLSMSAGILIWPVVFVVSDIINEYYGRKGVRFISLLTAILISYSFLFLFTATSLPPAKFWMNLYPADPSGNPFDINYAYESVFRQSMGIIVGSVTAFLVSQLIDTYTFHYLKFLTGNKKLWLRATGSTAVSQLIDSFVILFIAFYLLGNWTFTDVLRVGIVQYSYKLLLAILLTPLVYLVHYIADQYLGRQGVKGIPI